MNADSISRLRDMPRDHLEVIALRALFEIRRQRSDCQPNSLFFAVFGGFIMGSAMASLGFVVGTLIH